MSQSCTLPLLLALTTITLVAAQAAHAQQDFPNKPVHMVVPFGAASTPDNMLRILAPELNKQLGQTVVIENKPGADGNIGLEYVAKAAAADGYTSVVTQISGLVTLPLLSKSVRFDPIKDLPPLVGMVEGKYVLTTAAGLGTNSFKDFVALAKANPGKYNFGTSNSVVRMQTEAILRELGLNLVHVPYKTGAAYIQAVGGNEVQFGLMAEGSAVTLANRIRAIAVTGQSRTNKFADVPTFAELNLPNVLGVGYSLHMRVGTPKFAMDKMDNAMRQTLNNPQIKEKLANMGLEVLNLSAEATARRIAAESKIYSEVARSVGIQAE